MQNVITFTNRPKETILGAIKRAVDNSAMYGKLVHLNFNGSTALVYPNETPDSVNKLTSYITLQELGRQVRAGRK